MSIISKLSACIVDEDYEELYEDVYELTGYEIISLNVNSIILRKDGLDFLILIDRDSINDTYIYSIDIGYFTQDVFISLDTLYKSFPITYDQSVCLTKEFGMFIYKCIMSNLRDADELSQKFCGQFYDGAVTRPELSEYELN